MDLESLANTGDRNPNHPARSESLYQLHYSGRMYRKNRVAFLYVRAQHKSRAITPIVNTVKHVYEDIGICDTWCIAVVPADSSLLTVTLHSSVITTLFYSDTTYPLS
jgi:hypothetical protein